MSLGRALLLALALLATPLAEGQPSASAVLQQAEALLAIDPAQALELANSVLATAPNSAAGHAIAGRAAAQSSRPELAAEHLGKALALGGGDLRLELYLASALWETNRYDEAEAVFRQAWQSAQGGRRGLVAGHQLGRFLLWQGRSAEALAPLERALALDPRAPDVVLDLARALELENDPRALAAFSRAVELAPESPRARWGLAQQLVAAGRREEAAVELDVFLQLYQSEQRLVQSEGLARAVLDQAWTLLRQGDAAAAVRAFSGLGEGAEALEGLARAESARGRHPEATAVLERAIRRFPENRTLVQLLERERLAAAGKDE